MSDPQATSPSQQLRRIIRESGHGVRKIERMSGVSAAALSRFLNGKTSLTLDRLDRLAGVFDLDLIRRSGSTAPATKHSTRAKSPKSEQP